MSELTNVFARNMRDLTTPTSTGANPNTFDNAKIPIGNAPQGFEGIEALTVKQIKELAAEGREEELDALNLKIKNEEIRAKEVEATLINDKANKASTLSGYGITDAYTQGQIDSKVNNLESKKADTSYVDDVVGAMSTDASKQYATLALANADIANIALNKNVFVSEAVNGGYWYKATAEATSLTKSPYDPLVQSKNYTDSEINNLGILHTASNVTSFAVVDEDDKRTWIEADDAGKPTEYSASLMAESVGLEQNSSTFLSVAIVDEDDTRTWLEADEAGKPTPYAAGKIIEAIDYNDAVTPSAVKSTYQTQSIKAVSGPDINCVGDSMTAGAGSNGNPYSKVLQDLLMASGSNAVVHNSGVGGETSPTITARMGGYSFQVRVTGGVIPATTTPVEITFDQINGQRVRPLLQGNGGASGFIGDLAGVRGSITLVKPNGGNTWDEANYYTFTRSVAGSEVIVNRPEPFVTDYAKARQGDIKIIWIGQNGPSTERAIQDAKAIIQSMQALDKRYIVISKPTATPADDAAFFAEFGDRFIAAKKYLVEFGLADAGITPTEQDITDMENYTIPLPLCNNTTDRLHWNAAGYSVLANLIFKKLNQLGWI